MRLVVDSAHYLMIHEPHSLPFICTKNDDMHGTSECLNWRANKYSACRLVRNDEILWNVPLMMLLILR